MLAFALLTTFPGLRMEASSDPDLLVYEGFDYDAGSSLEYLDGGTGWSTPWKWRPDFVTGGERITQSAIVEEGSLAYPGLDVSGNHVHLTGENGELQLGRGFAEAVGGVPGTSTWISYIGQRVGPEADPSSPAYGGSYPYGANLYPRGTSLRFWNTGERFSVGNYSNQTTNTWSIYGSGLPIAKSEVSFSADAAFVVARIDHKETTGDAGDDIHVWINPEIGTEPDLAEADITLVDVREDAIPVHVGELTWLSPFAGQASVDSQQRILRPHAELLVDEIRVGRTAASVMPVTTKWAGFEKTGQDNVFTGEFLQALFLGANDWNYAYSLQTWLHLAESDIAESGGWVYFRSSNVSPPSLDNPSGTWEGFPVDGNGIAHTGRLLGPVQVNLAPWVWSPSLQTWLHVPSGSLGNEGGWAYVLDRNPQRVFAPSKALQGFPMDGDQHVEVENYAVNLEWRAGQRAQTHDIYYGTDPDAVANATPDSPEFLGNFRGTSMELLSPFYSMEASYWRVDAVNPAGTAKGDVWMFRPAQLAFPGAEGWGRYAVGGRHGRVVHVTNLNDSGPGSLRAAIEDETGPRIVVFDVGGLITLEPDITINSEDKELTVAGQTAPYPGITVRKQKLGVSGGQDVVIRFLRIKPGNIAEETTDGTGFRGSNFSIMDHMSVGWSIDEAFSSRDAKNITLQRTMLEEALNQAGHKNYPDGARHGYAASVGGDVGSFHHNLLAHCNGRNWSMAGGLLSGAYAGRLDFTNNVVYNWDGRTTDGGAHEVNFVANYYKGGPACSRLVFLNPQHEKAGTGTQRYFVEGNILDVVPMSPYHNYNKWVGPENQADGYTTDPEFPDAYVDAPFFDSHVETHSARLAYKLVLSDVGANQPTADDHDYRIIGEVIDRDFHFFGSNSGLPGLIDNEDDTGSPWAFYETPTARPAGFDTDLDGLPDWFEAVVGTNPDSPADDFSDMRSDPDGDGFTLMDDYLAWLAAPHYDCDQDGSVIIDLSDLARGFTDTPVFEVLDELNGTATVQGNGTSVEFLPSAAFTGLAEFTFRVTDADGNAYVFTLPRVRLTRGSIAAGGPDQDVMADFQFQAVRDPATGATIQIDRLAA